jgi:hypothetical protein
LGTAIYCLAEAFQQRRVKREVVFRVRVQDAALPKEMVSLSVLRDLHKSSAKQNRIIVDMTLKMSVLTSGRCVRIQPTVVVRKRGHAA